MIFRGEILAELREDKGWTQKELGKMLSVSSDMISRYENNKSIPGLKTVCLMAQIFDKSIDYLTGLTNDEIPLNRRHVIYIPDSFTEEDIKNIKGYIRYVEQERINNKK